ncbi:MAG: alpha/beta hydrolase [Carbonactinosporaceae bacterium]
MMQKVRAVRPLDWAFPSPPVRREMLARLPGTGSDPDPDPDTRSGRPPLLFVHDAGHGAWCFDEHWLPHAAGRGFPSYAVSLRGHGDSGGRPRLRRTLLRDYLHDVLQAAVSLPTQPVIIGHAMGGLVVQRVLARYPARAGVLVAPVPVRHGAGVALSIGRAHPADLVRTTLGRSLPMRPDYLFRELDPAAARAHTTSTGPESPLVQYQITLPRRAERPRGGAPVLVAGTPDDRLIPLRDLRRTARFYGTEPVLFPGMGHDMMLDARWREPIDAILDWVERVTTAR